MVFCDDELMRELNRTYRGHDHTTDVLSFAQGTAATRGGPESLLGDVVISVPQAARQARAARHPLRREIEWLLLHGVLHLLGFDDESAAGLQEMEALQRAAMRLHRLGRPPLGSLRTHDGSMNAEI